MFITKIIVCFILIANPNVLVQPKVISIPLYKHPAYNTPEEFQENAHYFKGVLPFYFLAGSLEIPVAKIDKNVDYMTQIEIGSSKQRFTVLIDTSFSGLWVPSTDCFLSISCYKKNKYNKDNSIHFIPDILEKNLATRKIMYNNEQGLLSNYEENVQGSLGFDTLLIDDGDLIPATHFIQVTSMTYNPFRYILNDGVLGLGFPDVSLEMNPPFFTMLDRGLLDSPEFSLYVGKHGQTGELVFGGRNKELFDVSSLKFHPLSNPRRWQLKLDSITFMGKELCPSSCDALIDTSAALIAAPADIIKTIYTKLGRVYSEEPIRVDCHTLWKLPALKFYINSQEITMTSYDYIIKVEQGPCFVGLMVCPKENYWILGNLFLSRVYTVFNVGESKIGFAKLSGISTRSNKIMKTGNSTYPEISPEYPPK